MPRYTTPTLERVSCCTQRLSPVSRLSNTAPIMSGMPCIVLLCRFVDCLSPRRFSEVLCLYASIPRRPKAVYTVADTDHPPPSTRAPLKESSAEAKWLVLLVWTIQ